MRSEQTDDVSTVMTPQYMTAVFGTFCKGYAPRRCMCSEQTDARLTVMTSQCITYCSKLTLDAPPAITCAVLQARNHRMNPWFIHPNTVTEGR